MPPVSPLSNMVMYADNTTLYCNMSNNTNENDLNSELNKISERLASNNLTLNAQETKFMVFHSIQRKVKYPVLTFKQYTYRESNTIQRFRYYITLYSKMAETYRLYIKKVSKAIGVMYSLKRIYPEAVLLIIYQSIINTHFTYDLLVWGSKINTNHPLYLLQNRALRIVKNTDYVAHSEPICKDLRLLKMEINEILKMSTIY